MANSKELNLENGFVWVAIRRQEVEGDGPSQWHIQGIFGQEDIAVSCCIDETYFVGPLPFNACLPHELIEWVGAYFPIKKQKEKD